MPRCSNSVLCFANFLAVLVVAVPLICGGLSLSTEANSQCQRSLQWVTIVSGTAILVLSLLGIFGSCCRLNSFLLAYLLFMSVLIVLTLVSMAFSFAMTSREAGVAVSDLRLGNASSWMQRSSTRDWEWIEGCMVEVRLCDRVMRLLSTDNGTAAGEIVRKKEIYSQLLPVQIGCCKPPSECGYKHVNETYWAAPGPGTNSTNGDCRAWSNERMCYGCDSCKAGMVEIARRNIQVNAWGSIPILVVLIVIYSIGCCAFRNNMIDINIIHDDSYAMLG